MFAEEELVLVSALEHYAYCPRQFALMYIEQVFEDNVFTVIGQQIHEHVDQPHALQHADARIEYAVPLWSETLGLVGRADAVELLRDGSVWPVEHKHGRKRMRRPHDLQLCAQALCLEEMLGVSIRRGSIFYHTSRRWREVEFTSELIMETKQLVEQVRAAQSSCICPPPLGDARCVECSLNEICSPDVLIAAENWDPARLTEREEF